MSATGSPLTIAAVGCGSRSRTYTTIAATMPDRYKIVAGADPISHRVDYIREISNNPDFRSFDSAEALLAEDQLADVLIIGTQDNYHYEPAKAALKKGYHLLLEKPACQTLEESKEIEKLAAEYNRKVILCFVLRYTPIYRTVKQIVDSGKLGDIISLRASEGVGAWHQVHSYVRGHWAKSGNSTPMIIAKCSHDLDIIAWIMGQRCRRVSSFGSLSHFKASNNPEGHPENCFDFTEEQQQNCPYNTQKYLDEDHQNWLKMVYPDPDGLDDKEKVTEWLKQSPWARNAYLCDNDVVDHQIVNMEYENGATAALTMTAFDYSRSIEIYGTKASLRAGDANKIHFNKDTAVIRHHISGEIEEIQIEDENTSGYQGHGGGDYGVVDALYDMITTDDEAGTISNTIESHLIGFAAEKSRLNGGMPVTLDDLR